MRPLRYPLLWRSLGWLMLVGIVVIMAIPTPRVDIAIDYADKWIHVLAFAALGAWAAMLYPPSPALALRALGLIAFGLATEGMQHLIPWRSADWADTAANTIGVLLGVALAWTPIGKALLRLEQLQSTATPRR